MISFHSVILLLSSASTMSSLIHGDEIVDKPNRNEITKVKHHADGPLGKNDNFNKSSTVGLFYTGSTIPSQNLEAYMSTVDIIISRGYHAEIHPVRTDDDYILMLHRIPYAKGQTSGPKKGRPVFIQHGVGESSADWVLLPSEKSLAFILADMGYDVWLGNFRGNTYSRGHVTFDSSNDDTYWKFTFDEMGRYDLPAAFNHVLTVTGREKLIYVGFSLGTTTFFICMDYHPKLNDKVELMVALAPATTLAHTRAMILRFIRPVQRLLQFLLWLSGHATTYVSQDDSYTRLTRRYCLKNARLAILCYNVLFLLVGADYGNMNPELIRVFKYHFPAGASIRTLVHLGQNIPLDWNLNPQFNKYDYGWIENSKRYRQLNPPAYNLSKVTVPVYIFHGANDYLATPRGVKWTASRLPNVKQVVLVNDPSFNHIDMVFHRNAKELVYNEIVELLPSP